jgi:hypothetical protein
MAFNAGDKVYVLRSLLGLDENDISPFYQTKVSQQVRRSVIVDLPGGDQSKPIATSKITLNFGVLIIRIGDYKEEGLIDPLAKSVLHYSRMILPGDSVKLIEVRTEAELEYLWNVHHGMCAQVVLVGHGSKDGFLFGDKDVSAKRMADIFDGPNPGRKEFISLGCQTGLRGFGKGFSKAACVSHFIASFHSIHGSVASLFAQTYLYERYIRSSTVNMAFKHTREGLGAAVSLRLWENGDMYTD